MPIKFFCQQCRHQLKTPDDSAGKKSRCPQCGHIQTIPLTGDVDSANAGLEPLGPSEPLAVTEPRNSAPVGPPWQQSDNPFAERSLRAEPNPYAAPISASAQPATNPRATIFPGIWLIAISATSSLFLGLGIMAGVVTVIDEGMEQDDLLAFIFLGVTLAVQFLILWGGINMVRCRGYYMAMAGTIAAIVPLSACWCMHLPFGLWALAILAKSGTRAIFQAETRL